MHLLNSLKPENLSLSKTQVPGEMERFDLLQSLLSSSHLAPDVSIPSLARQTAALVAADLQDLLIRAKTAAFARAQISTSVLIFFPSCTSILLV